MERKIKVWRCVISCLSMFLALFVIKGCDTTESTGSTVAMSFSPGSGLQKLNAQIELTEVKILLKDIKLERDDDDFEDDDNNIEGDDVEFEKDDDSDCETVKVGPIVVALNINGITTDFVVGNIPAGVYEEVKFKIHKPKSSEEVIDSDFRDSLKSYSVVVRGLFDGNPFEYKSRKSTHQEIEFEEPLVVEENTNTNFTITVDPYTWFYKDEVLLDPNDPLNAEYIDKNIKYSFKKAFKDEDRDGDDD